MSCGATFTVRADARARLLALFLEWLLSKRTQSEMGVSARTFRRLTSEFWSLWPMAPVCDEVHHVVHVDGIWLKRECVVLIACTRDHVIGWHLARSESAAAWTALLARIAPPDVVVTDGGGGFEKARRAAWPSTRVQRCTFHAFEQVKRCTTTRPKTQAGVDLYAIAKGLLEVSDASGAAAWLARYAGWCAEYDVFLKEREVVDGRSRYRHERLRKARRGLDRLCRDGTLFTFADEALLAGGPVPATNNRIEGGGEPPDKGGAQRAPRHEARQDGEGGLLVLQQQAGGSGDAGEGARRVPHRRDDSGSLSGGRTGEGARQARREMGHRSRLDGSAR